MQGKVLFANDGLATVIPWEAGAGTSDADRHDEAGLPPLLPLFALPSDGSTALTLRAFQRFPVRVETRDVDDRLAVIDGRVFCELGTDADESTLVRWQSKLDQGVAVFEVPEEHVVAFEVSPSDADWTVRRQPNKTKAVFGETVVVQAVVSRCRQMKVRVLRPSGDLAINAVVSAYTAGDASDGTSSGEDGVFNIELPPEAIAIAASEVGFVGTEARPPFPADGEEIVIRLLPPDGITVIEVEWSGAPPKPLPPMSFEVALPRAMSAGGSSFATSRVIIENGFPATLPYRVVRVTPRVENCQFVPAGVSKSENQTTYRFVLRARKTVRVVVVDEYGQVIPLTSPALKCIVGYASLGRHSTGSTFRGEGSMTMARLPSGCEITVADGMLRVSAVLEDGRTGTTDKMIDDQTREIRIAVKGDAGPFDLRIRDQSGLLAGRSSLFVSAVPPLHVLSRLEDAIAKNEAAYHSQLNSIRETDRAGEQDSRSLEALEKSANMLRLSPLSFIGLHGARSGNGLRVTLPRVHDGDWCVVLPELGTMLTASVDWQSLEVLVQVPTDAGSIRVKPLQKPEGEGSFVYPHVSVAEYRNPADLDSVSTEGLVARTDAAGNATFTGLPPGKYVVRYIVQRVAIAVDPKTNAENRKVEMDWSAAQLVMVEANRVTECELRTERSER